MRRRRFWFNYPYESRNAATYWLRYALAEPRDFLYTALGRITCRLGRHNTTCRGRADHPRSTSTSDAGALSPGRFITDPDEAEALGLTADARRMGR